MVPVLKVEIDDSCQEEVVGMEEHYHEVDVPVVDIETGLTEYAAAPLTSGASTAVVGIHDPSHSHQLTLWTVDLRVQEAQRQTKLLAFQSRRQFKLIEKLSRDQNKHVDVIDTIANRLGQTEERVAQMYQNMTAYQVQTDRAIQGLQDEVRGLVARLDGNGGTTAAVVDAGVVDLSQPGHQRRQNQYFGPAQEQQHQQQREPVDGGQVVVRESFVDVYGRKRKLCRFCGDNFSASYVRVHEGNKVCVRRQEQLRQEQQQEQHSEHRAHPRDQAPQSLASQLIIEEISQEPPPTGSAPPPRGSIFRFVRV